MRSRVNNTITLLRNNSTICISMLDMLYAITSEKTVINNPWEYDNRDQIYKERHIGMSFNSYAITIINKFIRVKQARISLTSNTIIRDSFIPIASLYNTNASRLFRLIDYSQQISVDINEVAHKQGLHIIIGVEYEDINPFNIKGGHSHRYIYYIKNIVSTATISDEELYNVASI